MDKKAIIIINPKAGMMHGKKHLGEIIFEFAKSGYYSTVFMTQKAGDGKEYAKKYAKDSDLVVCIGGDGTFNEVVSGMLDSGVDIKMGYIPAGSTNDFANSLKLSVNQIKAAKDIVDGDERKYDVGTFNGRVFAYVASFGAFTKASYSAPQDMKNSIGHLAYILEGIKEISSIRSEHIRIELENETIEGDYIFGAISNSTSLGGILKLSADSIDMNDGLLEIMLIKLPKNLAELAQIINALSQKNYNCEMISFMSVSSAKIYASSEMNWTIDGECEKGSEYIEIKNVRDAIKIVVPRK
ncbi:MAG: diacylglycerol kinase family lipid kinase [Ruminococcaceae bacterium]|nr:diacylglycerol kinase family lipid kinase [Oscillospiraceae bacterium]